MMERCQKFFSLFTVLHLLCAKRFFAFVSDSLVSNSKQALTPKTETLIFLVIAANHWWRRPCDLHWNNEKPFNFLCQKHYCTLSSYLVFAGAPQSSLLSTMLLSRYFWSFLPLVLLFFSVLKFSPPVLFTSFLLSLASPSSVCPWILVYESARPALGFSTFPRTPAPPI